MGNIEFAELNPLQIFLLVLVEFGLTTPYDLLSKAGLGPGLTSPALKRLQEADLLTSTPGPRNRVRYAITEKGASRLQECRQSGEGNYWQLGQTDIYESLPRGITLAWLHSGVQEAQRGAYRAAENLLIVKQRREREAASLRESMNHLQRRILNGDPTADKGLLIGTAYQWIKAESDAALYGLQVEAIRRLRTLLPDLPPAPRAEGRVWSELHSVVRGD